MLTQLWSELRFRLRAVFRRGAMERELDSELAFHLERETQKLIRLGVPLAEAERSARLAFGGISRIKDDTRDARGVSFIDELARDVRYALRGLRARPAFTSGVVITLGLGIGVNAAMFGVLDRLLLRSPDYLVDAPRVNRVYLSWIDRGQYRSDRSFEYTRYADLTRWTTSFDATAAFAYRNVVIGEGEDVSPHVVGAVSASFFAFFSARPALGRFFVAAEDATPRGAPVAVLAYGYWQSRYAGRADIIGSSLKIERQTYTVIGVAPKRFSGISDLRTPAAFIPITSFAATMNAEYYRNYNWGWLEMLARRKPGVSVEAATSDLTNAYQRSWNAQLTMERLDPISVARPKAAAERLALGRGPQSGPEAKVVVWMSGVAMMVLLIACANVANLLLVRSLRRRRELALRVALGGSRARMIQQLLTETIVLAALGGAVGVVAAQWGGGTLRRVFLTANDTSSVVSDPRTLVFALAVTIGAALIAGLAPALQGSRGNTADSLKAGAREGAYAHSRARSFLLVLQAALSVVLLVAAGLFVRSLREVHAIRLGYDVDPLIVLQANLRDTKLAPEQATELMTRIVDETRAIPVVANVTRAVAVPFYSSETRGLWVPGVDSVRKLGRFMLQVGSSEYFATMGTRILRGRGITPDDRRGAPLVAVVSEAMAHVLWPDHDAIGQCMRVDDQSAPCTTVVGIAENIRTRDLTGTPEFHYYLPADQFSTEELLIVRVNGAAIEQADAIRRRVQRVMPGSAYVAAIPMERIMAPRVRSWQYGATMFAAFGALALVIAAIGLYSVVAFAVTQRTHELGLRIALGAQMNDILRLVISEGIGLALAGVTIGFAVALTAGAKMSPLLFNVSPRDPVTYAVVATVLVAVAAVASAVPAMRAAKVDPNIALRTE